MFCLSQRKFGMGFILSTLAIFYYSNALSQRPNIIYIMTDDMGYGDLSGYGSKDSSTPNLDKLASQGIKFVNAYAAAPICTPTRAAFMTGRYPARTPVGLYEPLTASKEDSAIGLTNEFSSLGVLVKKGGYLTALIGKWHLGALPQHSPLIHGFDYFFGIHTGAADYISHKSVGRNHDLYENETPVYPEGYLTDLFTEKAVAFIRQKHEKPFFLALTYNAPHWPWQGPGDKAYPDTVNFRLGGSPQTYAAMMKSLDDGVGMIMRTLDEEHLSRETIIIFTNDNGGERYSHNGAFTNRKGTLWEGGIRVPAFVRWTGKIKPGIITEQMVITMDWTATILALSGAKAYPGYRLDGKNMMPLLLGNKREQARTFYWKRFQGNKQKAMRDGRWKYLVDEKGEWLFDLAADPGEQNDLKAEEKIIFRKLKNKYAKWEKGVLQASID